MKQGVFQNGFRKLIVWKESHQLTLMVYTITAQFPAEEKFGLVSQLRRASSSVGAQLAEGSRMHSGKHRRIYYERAYASLSEVDNFLELALDLHFISEEKYEELLGQLNRTSALLNHLIASCNVGQKLPS